MGIFFWGNREQRISEILKPHLDPDINFLEMTTKKRANWTRDNDKLLLKGFNIFGRSAATIRDELLGNFTSGQITNRLNSKAFAQLLDEES